MTNNSKFINKNDYISQKLPFILLACGVIIVMGSIEIIKFAFVNL